MRDTASTPLPTREQMRNAPRAPAAQAYRHSGLPVDNLVATMQAVLSQEKQS
jgi:hypothetical protein